MTAIYLYHGKTAFTFNYFNYKNGTQAINLAELEMPCGSDIILVGAPNRAGVHFIAPARFIFIGF